MRGRGRAPGGPRGPAGNAGLRGHPGPGQDAPPPGSLPSRLTPHPGRTPSQPLTAARRWTHALGPGQDALGPVAEWRAPVRPRRSGLGPPSRSETASGHLSPGSPGPPVTRASGHPGLRSPGPPVTRTSGHPDLRSSGPPVTRTSGHPDLRRRGDRARRPVSAGPGPHRPILIAGRPARRDDRLCTGAAPGRLRACGKRLWTKAVDNSGRCDPPLRTVFHRLANPCGNWGSTMMSFVHTCGYRCGELWITLSTALSTTGDNRAVSALETSRARPHYPLPWGPP